MRIRLSIFNREYWTMGGETFKTKAKGKTAKEAFDAAVAHAQHEYGHGGYTGTIAEKDSFTLIPRIDGLDVTEQVELLFDKDDPRINDKWGPAGCIALGNEEFLFFGWASS